MQQHELLISLSYCYQTLYPVCIFTPSAFEVADRLLIRLTVLQCLWSAVALWKVTWGGSTSTVSQQFLSALTGRQSFPSCQSWDVTTAFLPWHCCLIWRPKLWGTKQAFLLRTATNWSFGLSTITIWNLYWILSIQYKKEQYPASSLRAILILRG